MILQLRELRALRRVGDTLLLDAQDRKDGPWLLFVVAEATRDRIVLAWKPRADAMQAATDLPFLHIGDATAAAIRAAGLDCVGLLGTRFTMEQDFYRARLEARGIRVLVPEADDRATVHRIIYDELCLGDIRPTSRTAYLDIIGRLAAAGAQGVVLGCTEIPLLVSAGDTSLPLFDTTALHARFAADFALG